MANHITSNARFAAYYERRLIDAANGRLTQNNVAKRYQPASKIIPMTDITKTDEFAFEVVSTSDRAATHTVDMNLSVCTCHVGMTGAPCKHQLACAHHIQVSTTNYLIANDTKMRRQMMRMATGATDVAARWFTPLTLTATNDTDMTAAGTVTQTHGTGMTATTVTQTHDTDMTAATVTQTHDTDMTAATVTQTHDTDRTAATVTQTHDTDMTAATVTQTHDTDMIAATVTQTNTDMTDNAAEETIQKLDAMRDDMVKCLGECDPYHAVLERMLQQYACLSLSARISALNTFGRYTGAASAAGFHGRRRRGAIGVQPTAVARRTTVLGGRRCLHSGRKPKEATAGQPKGKSDLMPKRRPARAPHSLSACVGANKAIGTNHSAKW